MKQKLIEALTYPRLFVLENIDPAECARDGFFEATSDRCHECGLQQQCHWLTCLNSFAELAAKPLHTIHASLLYSIDLIEAHNKKMQHDPGTCNCETCAWCRDARELTREFSQNYAWPIGSPRGIDGTRRSPFDPV